MKISKNFNLKSFNTFGISVNAKFFALLEKEEDLIDILNSPEFKNNLKLFLGGGSNILFVKDFNGMVILNKLKGIEIIEEDENFALIRSMAGELWNDLVMFTVNKGYWGLENLTLIPGTVGASPVQNIGAYGVELKDTIESVEAYNTETGEKRIFSKDECEFGYRTSVFKTTLQGKYFISSITLKLKKHGNKNVEYRVLKDYLHENNISITSPRDISDAVIAIRKSKLPDPSFLGNAGSFFKNVYIDEKKKKELLEKHGDMPIFTEGENIKIPSGWLIEKCGWKGKKIGNVGVHEKQALILVNYGNATGQEVKDFSEQIINSVNDKFGLILEREVNLI